VILLHRGLFIAWGCSPAVSAGHLLQ
jgi:hypothetical protein